MSKSKPIAGMKGDDETPDDSDLMKFVESFQELKGQLYQLRSEMEQQVIGVRKTLLQRIIALERALKKQAEKGGEMLDNKEIEMLINSFNQEMEKGRKN